MAWKRFLERARQSAGSGGERPSFQVSRGGAVYLAVAEAAARYGEEGSLELEAVEEPSAIAGQEVTEFSYAGVEPWLVLLLNRDTLHRYVVVVSPQGEVVGAMDTPMGEWEHVFLPAPGERQMLQAPRRRRRRRWMRRRT
jgi:hypothetical protein